MNIHGMMTERIGPQINSLFSLEKKRKLIVKMVMKKPNQIAHPPRKN